MAHSATQRTLYEHYGYPPPVPEDDHNYEIYYKRSTDNGASWEDDVRLTVADGVSASPSIAAYGSNLYVSWHDNRDGNYEIYFKYSTDDGTTWSDDIRLTNDPAVSQNSAVRADDSGNVYVVWDDKRGGDFFQVYFKKGELIEPEATNEILLPLIQRYAVTAKR